MPDSPHTTKSIFQGRFVLTRLLGKGGFGEVYAGIQTSNDEPVAVKLEKITGRSSFLFHEARVMQDIQKTPTKDGIAGIATLKYFGQEGDYRMLIMSLHGSSLETLHEKLGRFSLKTTVMLADQMLARLEYIHAAGYVHRDLKPDNFLVGKGAYAHRIFMIDFGLSSKYLTSEGAHREMTSGKSFLGTSRFASLRTHQGYSQSRRDDIEQLVYMMVYMYRGRLPWSGLNIKDREQKEKKIGDLKSQLKPGDICAKCPRQFEDLLYYARGMGFTEKPQYEMCSVLIRSVLDEMSPPEKLDNQFDWVSRHSSTPKAPLSPTNDTSPVNEAVIRNGKVSPDGTGSAPNVFSNAKGKGLLSGFESTPTQQVLATGDRDC